MCMPLPLGRSRDLPDPIADALHDVLAPGISDPGDVLIFLPGVEEIRRTLNRLESLAERDNLLLLPLHGSLTAEEQINALRPAQRRKVILATNIAETSLTIEGVRTVIDSGLARIAAMTRSGAWISLNSSASARPPPRNCAGRAGRTAPGRCLRLWSQAEERAMPDFEVPEIRRVDLCGTVLLLHAWGKPTCAPSAGTMRPGRFAGRCGKAACDARR